jgi:creatinine amidohydrolase
MVIVNGHGGNAGIVGVAATQLADHEIRAVALSYWSLLGARLGEWAPGDHGLIGHAGQSETSAQLYLQPERVDASFRSMTDWAGLEALSANPLTGVGYQPPSPMSEAPNGVYGNAPAGEAEIGELIVTTAAERLAELMRSLPAAPGRER